jgi:transposase-like protein
LFDFDLAEISANQPMHINSKINLAKIHHSQYTLGLVLTYYVNYGLSSRKTARILYEVHGIKITHQTVINYAEAAASITETINESYPYDLSNTITFDETYIKVNGKSNYVFFGSDTTNKIITSYRIFKHRSTKNAVTTLYQTFNKFSSLPEDLSIVTDGNPIYNASQVFFQMNNINFDLYQVIGVKNKDDVSRKWRVYKQVEERLNRTYKQNYYGTNGYGSLRNANVYMSLYVSFYNFLRTHSALKYKPPIQLDIFDNNDLMPNKWLKLLESSSSLFNQTIYTA